MWDVTPEQAKKIDAVFDALTDIRREVTLYAFQEYVRATHARNGGNGFLASIGNALVEATTLDIKPDARMSASNPAIHAAPPREPMYLTIIMNKASGA